MTSKRTFVLALLAVILTACGGSNPAGPSGNPTPMPSPTPDNTTWVRVTSTPKPDPNTSPMCETPGSVDLEYNLVGTYSGTVVATAYFSKDGVQHLPGGTSMHGIYYAHGTVRVTPTVSNAYCPHGAGAVFETGFVVAQIEHYPDGIRGSKFAVLGNPVAVSHLLKWRRHP